MELRDKICLIAGASGAIGSAVAKRFRAESRYIAETYFTESCQCRVQNENFPGDHPLQLRLDVRQWSQVQETIQKVVKHFGRIDVLVNCTGVLGPIGPTATVTLEEWVQTIEINLIGTFYLTRAVLEVMQRNGRGKIIHFSGGGAAYSRPFVTAYSASKAALVRFTESISDEVRDKNIQVNAIAPGPVNGRMWEQMRQAGELGGSGTLRELKNMDETGGVPADRAASLALFLASDRSNGLTGRLISAVHDSWETMDQRIPNIMSTEAGTLRRVPMG